MPTPNESLEEEPLTAETEVEAAKPEPEEVSEQEDYRDKWQRALADQENARKRAEAEKAAFSRFALEGFIEDLLPVVDNFYRATDHIPEEQKSSPWVTGIQYIQKNLLDVLEQRGVREIPAKVGDLFNPTRHEAIGAQESEGDEDRVLEVASRGYLLHDRVLRPARVIVSKKADQDSTINSQN